MQCRKPKGLLAAAEILTRPLAAGGSDLSIRNHKSNCHSAVNGECLPRNIARSLGRQKNRNPFELTFLTDARNDVRFLNDALVNINHPVRQTRMKKAGRNRVDANSFSSPARRELARQTD